MASRRRNWKKKVKSTLGHGQVFSLQKSAGGPSDCRFLLGLRLSGGMQLPEEESLGPTPGAHLLGVVGNGLSAAPWEVK